LDRPDGPSTVAAVELHSGLEGPRQRRPIQIEPLRVYERWGDGHTVSRHCGTTPAVEADRLERHPLLPATGSFPDVATAQRSVEACVAANRPKVEHWRRRGYARLVIDHDMGEVIGDVLERRRWLAGDPTPVPATGVRVVLRRSRRYPAGFAVLTSYPVLHVAATYPRCP
jgi:Bacterial CdiA-CT RNAse A domain